MRTLFFVNHHILEINKVKIVSETDAFVILTNGRRSKKVGDFWAYYETREDAKQAILNRLLEKRHSLFVQMSEIEMEIEKATAL